MTEDCDHDVILTSCLKCGKSAKVILLHTLLDKIITECEKDAVLIGTTWYCPLAKIRRFEKWKERLV